MTISPGRHWNTWDSVYPAQMTYLPLGLTVTPCAFAASTGAFTAFPATTPGLTLGPRTIDGADVALSLEHAGTRLDWRYDKPADETLRGGWRTTAFGEWGLRFWVLLVLRLEPMLDGDLATWVYDPATGLLSAAAGDHQITVAGTAPPLMATFHDSIEDLEAEFRRFGYFFLGSRGTGGKVAVLRYNLEEMPDFRFAVSVAGAELALAALAAPMPAPLASEGGLDALRDLVGWNTVFDPINKRPYMSLSRNWVAQKFGGFGVWLDDLFYHALMGALFDPELARESIRAVLATVTPEGNFACLITGRDNWIDRSQPPVCSFVLWKIWQHTGADDLVDLAYDRLLQNHDWWFRRRDPRGAGLMSWGNSPVGEGLYKGTKLGAKNESSMDNSPIHDEAAFDKASWCLDSFDVGLNSLLALDGEVLADLARHRGDTATAQRLADRAAALRARIKAQLWDPARKVFANRRWDGGFVRSIAPTSFYPLLADAADDMQRQALLGWLHDPRKFGGRHRLPSVTRDDPAYRDNVYWRGRIWPPLNYLTYGGLKRQGEDAAATGLAEDTARLFAAAWARRQCPENFSAETGIADDQPDTDVFYGWGGLLPLIDINEIVDVTPWGGWELTHRPGDWTLGPLLAFGRRTTIASAGGWLSLAFDGRAVFATTLPGRLRGVAIAAGSLSFDTAGDGQVLLPGIDATRRADYAGRALTPRRTPEGLAFDLPAGDGEQRLEIAWTA